MSAPPNFVNPIFLRNERERVEKKRCSLTADWDFSVSEWAVAQERSVESLCRELGISHGGLTRLTREFSGATAQETLDGFQMGRLKHGLMEQLRELDPIAYVRFASVYRQFADLEALRDELEALSSGARPAGAQLPLLDEPEFAPPSLWLRPAAPINRTRTRRPVRPVQTPVRLAGPEPAPAEQPKRRRRAR